MSELFHGGEKKVEYIELVYDLIFVYRNSPIEFLKYTLQAIYIIFAEV